MMTFAIVGAKPLSDFVETADAPSIPTCSIVAEKMQSHVESIDPIEVNEEIISSGRQEKPEDAEDEGLRLIKAFSAENKYVINIRLVARTCICLAVASIVSSLSL